MTIYVPCIFLTDGQEIWNEKLLLKVIRCSCLLTWLYFLKYSNSWDDIQTWTLPGYIGSVLKANNRNKSIFGHNKYIFCQSCFLLWFISSIRRWVKKCFPSDKEIENEKNGKFNFLPFWWFLFFPKRNLNWNPFSF